MNNFEELVYNAMQSSLEGYAASVVDSIEFELKRELTTEEHQQVFVAVDRAITGIEVAQKEIADWRSVAEAAAQDDADWHKLADRDGELICKMANAIIAVGERAKKAEKERDDLLNQEFQQRLANAKHQLHMKDLAIHNIKASRKTQFRKRLAAEAELSAANEKLSKLVVLSEGWKLVPIEPTDSMVTNGFESEPDESFSDEKVWEQYAAMTGCQQAAHRAKLCWAAMLAAAPLPAGFTVEGE